MRWRNEPAIRLTHEMAQRAGDGAAHVEAAAVEDIHGDLEPAADLSEHVRHRHGRVVKVHFTRCQSNNEV